MTTKKKNLLKLLSVCLAYPDRSVVEALPEIESAAADIDDLQTRERLSDFLSRLKAQPLLALQEHYTAVFDMNPSASLNLTYHLMGDREDRGRALAELLEVYLRAGFEPAVNELPDFLPLMLEFMAESSLAEPHALVQRCLSAVPTIAGRLRENGSLYAAPLEVLAGVFPETTAGSQPE